MQAQQRDIISGKKGTISSRNRISSKAVGTNFNSNGKERRAFERFPVQLDARLFYGNLIYSGKVTDLSQGGMFVNTRVRFPVDSEFMMVVLVDGRTMKIPVRVRRRVKSDAAYNSVSESGIGVQLVDSPQKYMEFVDTYKSVL